MVTKRKLFFVSVRVTVESNEPLVRYKPISLTGAFYGFKLEEAKERALEFAKASVEIPVDLKANYRVTKSDSKTFDYFENKSEKQG